MQRNSNCLGAGFLFDLLDLASQRALARGRRGLRLLHDRSLRVCYARIRFGVGEIGKEIDQDEHYAQEKDRSLNCRQVAPRYGVDDIAPQSRPAEDRLGEDASGEVVSEVEPQ